MPVNTAELPGYGGRYLISFNDHVFGDGRLLAPEDGYYALSHPDAPEIVTLIPAGELHGTVYGQPIPGYQHYSFNAGTNTVYDWTGAAVPVITVPTKSWGKGEERAVRLSYFDADNAELVTDTITLADLLKGTGGTRGRVPSPADICRAIQATRTMMMMMASFDAAMVIPRRQR